MENQNNQSGQIKFDVPKHKITGYVFAFGAFVAVLVCVSVLFWQGSSAVPQIQENQSQIEELTEQTNKLSEAVAVVNQTDQALLTRDLELAETALPSEKRVTGFVSALSDMASESGTSVNQIEIVFGKVSTDSGNVDPSVRALENKDVLIGNDVVGVPLNMNVGGESGQILDLIGKVQQAMPLLGIKDMTYQINGSGNFGNLSVLIFSQPREIFNLNKLSKIQALTQSEKQWVESLSTKTNILQ